MKKVFLMAMTLLLAAGCVSTIKRTDPQTGEVTKRVAQWHAFPLAGQFDFNDDNKGWYFLWPFFYSSRNNPETVQLVEGVPVTVPDQEKVVTRTLLFALFYRSKLSPVDGPEQMAKGCVFPFIWWQSQVAPEMHKFRIWPLFSVECQPDWRKWELIGPVFWGAKEKTVVKPSE